LNSKTCEMVLSELLKVTKEPNITIAIPLAELEHVFGIPGNDVESALSSLSKDGIITVRFCPSDISICVLPAAFGYFDTKKEREKKERRKKWEDRAYSFFSGIITTLLVQWLIRIMLR